MSNKLNSKLIAVACIAFTLALSACSLTKPQYYIGGSGWKQIALIDAQGNKLWSHQLEKEQECNSVTQMPDKTLLYSFRQGAKVIDKNHQTLWEYQCAKSSEVHSASLTNEGNILLGICGQPAQIIEFSSTGEKIVDISFELEVENAHSQFRRVHKTSKGTYLVPVLAKKCIYEVDKKGQIINKVHTDTSVFSIEILKNGNWLLSCGDAHKLIELNPNTKEVVWQLSENDIEGTPLRFVAEAVRLKNGNTIICNWGGHANEAQKSAQVLEIDKNKKLIWKIEDYELFGNISTIDIN